MQYLLKFENLYLIDPIKSINGMEFPKKPRGDGSFWIILDDKRFATIPIFVESLFRNDIEITLNITEKVKSLILIHRFAIPIGTFLLRSQQANTSPTFKSSQKHIEKCNHGLYFSPGDEMCIWFSWDASSLYEVPLNRIQEMDKTVNIWSNNMFFTVTKPMQGGLIGKFKAGIFGKISV